MVGGWSEIAGIILVRRQVATPGIRLVVAVRENRTVSVDPELRAVVVVREGRSITA